MFFKLHQKLIQFGSNDSQKKKKVQHLETTWWCGGHEPTEKNKISVKINKLLCLLYSYIFSFINFGRFCGGSTTHTPTHTNPANRSEISIEGRTMDSVKSFFAGSSKDANMANNQQSNGLGSAISSRWGRSWSTSSQQADPDPTTSNFSASKSANPCDAKRKDSDSYFYIM